MAASFPASVWAGYTVVDLVSFWNQATANPISEEIVALEEFLIDTVRANGVTLIGPASGGPLAPTWRAMVGTDVPEATDIARGTIETASDAETATGSATDRALTPANLRSDLPLVPAALKGVRLDNSGVLIMPNNGRYEYVALASNTFNNLTTYSATSGHQWTLAFRKSHQNTAGNTTTVTGESLGNITWDGNDGSGFTEGAYIEAAQNGAAGVNTPADIVFYTSDGTGAPDEALRITKDQDLQITEGRNIGIGISSERIEVYNAGVIAMMGASVGVGTTSEFGSGAGVIGIANAGTNPSGAPTGGFVLWSQSGRAKIRENVGNKFIVQAGTANKIVAAAPYANDGYVELTISGSTHRFMTTA